MTSGFGSARDAKRHEPRLKWHPTLVAVKGEMKSVEKALEGLRAYRTLRRRMVLNAILPFVAALFAMFGFAIALLSALPVEMHYLLDPATSEIGQQEAQHTLSVVVLGVFGLCVLGCVLLPAVIDITARKRTTVESRRDARKISKPAIDVEPMILHVPIDSKQRGSGLLTYLLDRLASGFGWFRGWRRHVETLGNMRWQEYLLLLAPLIVALLLLYSNTSFSFNHTLLTLVVIFLTGLSWSLLWLYNILSAHLVERARKHTERSTAEEEGEPPAG